MEVKGHGGTIVRLDDSGVTITRKGLMARATVGKGAKHLPLTHITAVQFKPAGPLMNGFIQFTVPGGVERRSAFGTQTFAAVSDENSVIFTYSQRRAFEDFRDAVQAALTAAHSRDAPTPDPAVDVPAQIQQLASLRDAGVLSEEEFEAKKRELLARM